MAANPDLPETLRARGYRITPQRQLVLDALTALEHGTPDEICAEVQRSAPQVNLSTVYRTLELLEELGMVTHTHLGHGAPTYHSATVDEHLHLVCRVCGGIVEAPVELAGGLVSALEERHGFATDVTHFSIYGTCKGCSP
jgi:Fur family ferric uptake transcriptional regulator